MEYHLAIPTKLLEARPLPPVCMSSGVREGVSYRSMVLHERVPILPELVLRVLGGGSETLRVNIPISARAASMLRWQPLVYVLSMFTVAGLSIVSIVGLQGVLPSGGPGLVGFAVALSGFIAYRAWRSSITPVVLVDYDADVTVLAVKRPDVAAAIEEYVARLRLPTELRTELRAKQARLHRTRGTRSSLPEEARRGALSGADVYVGGEITVQEHDGALSAVDTAVTSDDEQP